MYNYDYEYFAHIGYEEALEYKISHTLPESIPCQSRSFANDIDGTSFVQDVSINKFVLIKSCNDDYPIFLELLSS